MRADRLVAVLLVLQARGRVTAKALAEELEVSVKTARRDLEALAIAGVPVYSQPGRGGGWSLLGGGRTDLSGLTTAEARALFLVAGPSASVAPPVKAALRKLVRALPATFRDDAQAAASAVILDPAHWGRSAPPWQPHLESLQRAVIELRQVRLGYLDRRRTASERTVHPLGLVRKGPSWYLLAGTDEGVRTFHIARVQSVEILDEPVARPEGFDLAETWRSVVATVERRPWRLRVVVRVPTETLAPLHAQFGADLTVLEASEDGHALVEIAAATPEWIAAQLAGWGAQLDVICPDEVRARLALLGAELVGRYGGAST